LNFSHAVTLPVQGRTFTWKKRIHGHLIYEKLDRAIGRHDWCSQYPDSSVSAGPFTCSDHSYVLLDTNPAQLFKRKTIFRYQPNWSAYAEVQRTVRKEWTGRTHGTAMFRFTRKLRSIKSALKPWSKTKFNNFRSQIDKNTTKLHLVESKLLAAPQSYRLNNWHFRLLNSVKSCFSLINVTGVILPARNG